MKKKIFSVILVLALALAMVFTVVACNNSRVEEAADAYRKAHLNDKYETAAYELPAMFVYEKETYTITWTASISNVKFAPSADGKTVNVTATRTAEAQPYTLTATFADADGKTSAIEFRATVPANPNAGGEYGDSFYLYMDQMNLGKLEWLKGGVNSQYSSANTSDKSADAGEFFAEEVTGGKKIFTVVDNVKKYFGASSSKNSDNGKTYQNLKEETDASKALVWVVNEDKSITTVIDGTTFYLGATGTSYSAQLTMEPAFTYFPVKVTELVESVNATATIKASGLNENSTVTFTSPSPVEGRVTAKVGTQVKFTVAPATGCTLETVKVAGTVLTAKDGVYTATLEKNCIVDVSVNNPNARVEYLHESVDMTTCNVTGDASQRVYTYNDATVTNIRGDAADPCKNRDSNKPAARFYKDSTFKIAYTGMLRVVLTMDTGYTEGFEGMTVQGATILHESWSNKAIIVFDNATNEFTSGKLAAQIRVSKIDIYTAEQGDIKTEPDHAGTEADPFTASDALLKAQLLELESSKYSQDKYWMEAYVLNVKTATVNSSTVYDIDLADTADGVKKIALYHGNLDGNTVPYIGDKVLIVGHITKYNSNYQFAGGTKAYPDGTGGVFATVKVLEVADGSIKASTDNEAGVTVIFTTPSPVEGVVSGKNGTEVKFTVSVDVAGKELDAVNVAGKTVTDTEGVYTVVLNGDLEVKVILKDAGITAFHTVTFKKTEYTEGTNQYNASWNHTSGGVSLKIDNFSNNNKSWDGYIKAGNKTLDILATIATTAPIKESIKQVVLTLDSINNSFITEVYLEVSANADFSNADRINHEEEPLAKGNVTFNIANPAENKYYRICVQCVKGSGSNGNISVSKIEFKGIGADAPVAKEAKIGNTEYATLAEAIEKAQAGDTIVLLKDIVVTKTIKISKKLTLDLNGKTISNTVDLYNAADDVRDWSVISVCAGGDLTIDGNGKVLAGAEANNFALDIRDEGGKLTIKNGEFVGNHDCVYVRHGTVTIEGGKFSLNAEHADGNKFVLNKKDNVADAVIVVKGGSFVNYDPSNSNSENPQASFVETGYTVTNATEGDNTIYTVTATSAE